MRKENPLRLRVAVGVLVALMGLLGLADFLPHTDDGCAVESHCLACRAHISAVTHLVGAATITFGAREVTAIDNTEDLRLAADPSRLLPPGRAPPLSA